MKLRHFFIFLLFSPLCFADKNILIDKTLTHTINNGVPREISLLKIKLSAKSKEILLKRASLNAAQNNGPTLPSTLNKQLGMGGLPVFDQGIHGTCVTFATTAAIDVLLNKGDYLSQVCPLQLSKFLEKNAYLYNAWNGSAGNTMLQLFQIFGIVNKENEKNYGCGGLYSYPAFIPDTGTEINVVDYHKLSEPLKDEIFGWSTILDMYQAIDQKTKMTQTLANVKASLRDGDRLIFSTILTDINNGIVGAKATFKAQNDTWVLPFSTDSLNPFAGHMMIITGYDDSAVAIDENGRRHRGLLTLRNSWGDKIGDNGNFYMSYTYFKTFALEVFRVRKVPPTTPNT